MRKTKKKSVKKEHSLVAGMKEVLAHVKGETKLYSYEFTPPKKIEVAKIRKKLGYSQTEFANHYGFAVSALRDWEQGRHTPERSARILLAIIAANPKMIEQTLAQLSPQI